MLLKVLVTFKHAYGVGERLEPKNIVAIRAIKWEGAGDATISFQGKDEEGIWYSFFKKDNKNIKLPKATDFKHWQRILVDVRGIRGIYKLVSEEMLV